MFARDGDSDRIADFYSAALSSRFVGKPPQNADCGGLAPEEFVSGHGNPQALVGAGNDVPPDKFTPRLSINQNVAHAFAPFRAHERPSVR
ncbi:MAG TPA: hypothetical protein VEJ46_18000 [Candidatus Acidoferrum sp.]|nr:hypothetical protein [Candidatus Acidoferrum sp.]